MRGPGLKKEVLLSHGSVWNIIIVTEGSLRIKNQITRESIDNLDFVKIKNFGAGAGEMDQWLRAFSVLLEALSSIPSTHVG